MTKGRKPDPDQYNLPFEAATGEERALLNAITLESVQAAVPAITEIRRGHALTVLHKLFSLDRWDRRIPKQAKLAEQLGIRERTVRRAIRDLVKLGLLVSQRRGRASNEYFICWPRVLELGVENVVALSDQNVSPARPSWPGESPDLAGRRGEDGRAKAPYKELTSSKPYLTNKQNDDRRTTGRGRAIGNDADRGF